ncbi:MAG: ABC transporter ATP-binding protein [Rhodospirillaceae bacterium BRH_c57]|nr:MAG: ABC transporter ATP-binding protein [Rhodospirillaceae bacterium BRH_c57]
MTIALDINRVSYSYGSRMALDDVSFTVDAGRFTALLGPNGAGKSTLFALATRLLSIPEGSISVFGADLARTPGVALRRMGIVFQQPTLDLDLSVAQNLRYFASLHGIGRREADRRMEAELSRLDMAERAGEKVRALNGGHRRRAEIARALLHRPSLLLLDEPTVGLDLPTRRRLIDHVHALCRDEGIAALWATHLIDEIDTTRDAVVILHQGRVRAAGTAAAVMGPVSLDQAFNTLTGAAE